MTESNPAKLSLDMELQVHYILCNRLFSEDVDVPVKAKAVPKLTFLDSSLKDLYDFILSKENVPKDYTIELFSHEGYPLHTNVHTLICKLYQWKISNDDLFYVFIRRDQQPQLHLDQPEDQAVDYSHGNSRLQIESSLFGSFSIKADLDRDSIVHKVAKYVKMPTNFISLSVRRGEGRHHGDVLTLVLKSPYQCSGPQGTEYGKETYNPTVPQTDKGISKFFSILKFICSKKRDNADRSRLISYLLQLTQCPPLVHAFKLLCENSKLSLPCWVALIEGCYQLFRRFLSEIPPLQRVKDKEIFELSDYFWGLLIGKSREFETKHEYKEQSLMCSISKSKMSLPVTVPDHDCLVDYQSVEENVRDEEIEVNFNVLRMLVYHPFEGDEKAYVCKGDIPISRPKEIPNVSLPCKWTDLQSYLVFLPVVPPKFLLGECLTFIQKGVESYLMYFDGSDQDNPQKVYDPVECKYDDCTEDMTAIKASSFNSVVVDISMSELESEEAIIVLLDSSKCMKQHIELTESRMDATKKLFGVFVMTCVTYKFPCSMGVYTFGDSVTKLQPLSKLTVTTMEELKEKVKTVTSDKNKQTNFFQAVIKAKEKLVEYTDKHSNCRRRILCIGASDQNSTRFLAKYKDENLPEIEDELKKHNVVVDAVELADTPNFRALARATGGTVLSPKKYSELFEMHMLMSNKHRLPSSMI